jgi:Spy/CpxP family protein refolding chaperone
MKRSALATAVYVAMVFFSGSVVGVFGYRLYSARTVSASVTPRPADYRKRYVEEMTGRLKLSPEQVTQLGSILDDTRTRYQHEHDRSKQQLAQIHDEQAVKIHEILSPAQVPEYEKYRAEREKAREARDKAKADHSKN